MTSLFQRDEDLSFKTDFLRNRYASCRQQPVDDVVVVVVVDVVAADVGPSKSR